MERDPYQGWIVKQGCMGILLQPMQPCLTAHHPCAPQIAHDLADFVVLIIIKFQ